MSPLTSEKFTTTTDSSGNFTFASVPPGTYSVEVRAPGFKHFTKQDPQLSASEPLPAGTIQLAVGTSIETVLVAAKGAPAQNQAFLLVSGKFIVGSGELVHAGPGQLLTYGSYI